MWTAKRATRPGARRWVVALLLCAVALGVRRADADDGTYDKLVAGAFSLLSEGEAAAARGDVETGRSKARNALLMLGTAESRAPDRQDTAFLGVVASLLARDAKAAGSWLDRYARRTPKGERDPDLHYLRGRLRLELEERPDLARESFEAMAALDPAARAAERDSLLFRALSDTARKLGVIEDYAGMAKLYREAIALAQRSKDQRLELVAWSNLGTALQLDTRFAEALDVFQELRKREPENPYWVWRAGENLANLTRWAEAVPVYEEVIRLLAAGRRSSGPGILLVHLRLANCRRLLAATQHAPAARAEALEKARQGIARYIELVPDDSRGPYWMGVLLLEELEKPHEAVAFFRRAYELDSVCDASLRNLLQIHRLHPPPPGTTAEAWAEEAARLEKDLSEHADARAKERRNRTKSAGDDGCE